MSLEELRKTRREWIDSSRKNNFEDGIKRLLTDLYPDNAHFIYELLQNAQDPGATVVRFTLTDEALEFEHNGGRLFSIDDVHSITSIGNSTKRSDPTSIGKFGVGFKAVFAYTTSPEIHSGDYHFRIVDMVVPEDLGAQPHPATPEVTRFRFPFDHPTKSSQMARREVESALLGLGDNALLFLSHIHTIEYLLPNGGLGHLRRVDKGDGLVEIQSIRPGASSATSHWLRFEKDVVIEDDDGSEKQCRIAIAYSLSQKDSKKAETLGLAITPLDRGQVSIYFPAEKETSNLRFHIHAPFASTVARDSVRETSANVRLLGQIAQLVVDSLHAIKARGLLTVGFLEVLPNESDLLPPFYEPIRKAIIEAFRNEELTPTKSGTFAAAAALYRGPVRISEVLDDEDLSFLTSYESPLWAANPPPQSQRADRFLESLEIDPWGWNELSTRFSIQLKADTAFQDWLKAKEDAWIRRFYALLGEAREAHHKYFSILWKEAPLVRVEMAGGHSEHVTPGQAFFPAPSNAASPVGIGFVKSSILSSGKSESQRRLARSFLEHVGVNEFDEKALLQLRLNRYRQGSISADCDHFTDVKDFVLFWDRNRECSGLFRDVPFLLSDGGDHVDALLSPQHLCLDAPYPRTGLSDLRSIHDRRTLSGVYKDELPPTLADSFLEFARAVGVMVELEVKQVGTSGNFDRENLRYHCIKGNARWTDSAIDRDYTIEHLPQYLKVKSVDASRLVWSALTKANRQSDKARFRPNQQYATRESVSQLVHHLKSAAWIPDADGRFRVPAEMTRDALLSDFPFDDRNGLLTAIGFGEHERVRSEAYLSKDQSAKELGFTSADEASDIATFLRETGRTTAELRSLLSRSDAVDLPDKAVPNPERRRRGVLEQKDGAPDRESVKRERSVISGATEESTRARAYLRPMYTNTSGQLVCQCCHQEMPFRVNNLHYFEAVKLVGGMSQHLYQCRLALCPTCAAMYQHARGTRDEELLLRLVGDETSDASVVSAHVAVDLAGRACKLWFVAAHLFDIRTVLANEVTIVGTSVFGG